MDPQPFGAFADSVQALRDGVDAQAAASVGNSRKHLVEQVESGSISPADLQLDFPSDFGYEYAFTEDGEEPLYFKLARFRHGLAALNDAVVAYAQLLVTLAGDEEINQAQFDTMINNLNTNAGSAAAALRIDPSPGNQALISTAAVKIFEAVIKSKRRKGLAEAIIETQPRVESFSRAGQAAVRFIAEDVKKTYAADLFLPLVRDNPDDVDAILKLNEETQTTLEALRSLWNSYGGLAAAHADLVAATQEQKGGLDALAAFNDEVIRLKGIISTLTADNQKAADGS